MKYAKIYQNSKSPTQSGTRKKDQFILEFVNDEKEDFIEPLMGWQGTTDPNSQIKLKFDSLNEALTYAKEKNISCEIEKDGPKIYKPKAYANNFKFK